MQDMLYMGLIGTPYGRLKGKMRICCRCQHARREREYMLINESCMYIQYKHSRGQLRQEGGGDRIHTARRVLSTDGVGGGGGNALYTI
jgi:hypothetical protein